jgi:hypothetical protein
VISPRRSRQDVGETGKMPDAVGAKSGESGFDFLEAVARIGCVSRDTQPIPERQSPQPLYRSARPRDLGRRLLAAEIQAHDVASDVSHENPSVGE